MVNIEKRLKGGHPNSLGNTVAIVEEVLADNSLFDKLFNCYFSEDEIVRLRVSSAMKRICKAKIELLLPYLDRFINEISLINQPSTKWTLAQLFELFEVHLNSNQLNKAKTIVKINLETETDWIVLNTSTHTLAKWSQEDSELKNWIIPKLKQLINDDRRSVSNRAKKYLNKLENK